MAEKTRNCTEQGRNLKPALRKSESIQMEPVVKPNEKIKVNFAGTLPDKLKTDVYISVAVDKWTFFPMAKVVKIQLRI